MTAKEFLSQARYVDRRVDRVQERIERLRAKLESGRMSNLSGMPRGGNSDWTDAEAKLIDLEKRYNAEIKNYCRMKSQVLDAIHSVGNATYEDVLRCRYLDGMTWEGVADALGYDVRYVQKLHGKALQRVRVPAGIE